MPAQKYLAYYIYFSHFIYNLFLAIFLFVMSLPYLVNTTEKRTNLSSKQPVFIFDMGGVLVKTDKKIAVKHLEFSLILKRIFWHFQSFGTLQSIFYDTLEKTIEGQDVKSLPASNDPEGRPLPFLMRAWLSGMLSGNEIKRKVFSTMSRHPEWFSNETEQLLIKNLVNFVFTPTLFVESQYIPDNVISFVKQLHVAGYQLFVLSNWDENSFILLKEKYKNFFDLFDGHIISGRERMMKPDYAIYELLLKRYNLSAEQCIFIDDQKENIRTALDANIIAILCSDFTSLSQYLSNYFLV